MDSLPEELQLRILEYLDLTPPSEVKARQEPSLNLTSSTSSPLKNVSCISRGWRRIALPLLFKYACLHVDVPIRRHWLACCLDHDSSLKLGDNANVVFAANTDQYHKEMLQACPRRRTKDRYSAISPAVRKMRRSSLAPGYEHQTRVWACRIYHSSKDFMDFLASKNLQQSVVSFVLLTDSMHCPKVDCLPSPVGYEWRYEASAAVWQHLLSVIAPERVAIVAPPMELACLTNSFIFLDGGSDPEAAWAFTDMDFHILEMRQQRVTSHSRPVQMLPFAQLQPLPNVCEPRDIAPSSVLNLQPWTSTALNEGSFLKAYGTYEYFERGPPSVLSSLGQKLLTIEPAKLASSNRPKLSALRSFTYSAIFPFATHLGFHEVLPQLETLDLQLAPDPQSGILDDKARTGRAELQDCWQELISVYHDIATAISTFRMSREAFPRLKTFICRDMRTPALKEDLDHIFTPLCLPVWAEYSDGVFQRIADKAELPGMDDII